ncbi:hypothetical protein ACROYT_G028364 [Oculina patagonica]
MCVLYVLNTTASVAVNEMVQLLFECNGEKQGRNHILPSNIEMQIYGDVGRALYLFGDKVTVVTSFEKVRSASVTWTSPPPSWIQTDPNDINDIRTVNMTVRKGSTQVPLRWNYTLSPGSVLASATFSIEDGTSKNIGTIFHDLDTITVFDTRFAVSSKEVATLIINRVTEKENAVYQCALTTTTGLWRYRIRVMVTVPAKLTIVSGDQNVHEGTNMTLICEATGKPTPNITWTRVQKDGSNSEAVHQGPTWDLPSINRTASGTYRCTADNGFGNSARHEIKVNVTYPAKIVKLASEHEVAAQQGVSLHCQAEGNPQPTYILGLHVIHRKVCVMRARYIYQKS